MIFFKFLSTLLATIAENDSDDELDIKIDKAIANQVNFDNISSDNRMTRKTNNLQKLRNLQRSLMPFIKSIND